MADPDTTLTDFALAALCAGFALALIGDGGIATEYALLFAALGLAALGGALWHGWFSGQHKGLGGALWVAVMLAVGLANVALWRIGAVLAASALLGWIAIAQALVYGALVLFVSRKFLLASAFTLPPTLLLVGLFAGRLPEASAGLGLSALVLALVGAGMQAARVGLPALRLGHNGLYHLVQAGAFTLLFIGRPGG